MLVRVSKHIPLRVSSDGQTSPLSQESEYYYVTLVYSSVSLSRVSDFVIYM